MAKDHYIDFNWHHRAQTSIAHAALTNSKRAESHVKGQYPTHLARGNGCHVWDVQGKKYTDYICGLGTNLLGYGNPEIAQAMQVELSRGCCLSFASTLEVEAAEKVKEMFPFIDKVRFLKTGSEAASAAVRIARTYTGQDIIFSQGYHGWSDTFQTMPPALGVPDLAVAETRPYTGHEDGIIILEPVELDNSQDRMLELERLKKSDSFVIYDEIITGFRYKDHSVAKYTGVYPDLICLGKAMANGMPLALVGGKKEIMECDEYFVSSTYAGERISLAAAIKTMTLLQTKYFIDDLWTAGQRFIDDFNSISDIIQIKGYATRGRFEGTELNKALFFQECIRAGVMFGPSWFYCFPHIEERDSTLAVCEGVLMKIKNGMARLQGEMPRSPFAERMRK